MVIPKIPTEKVSHYMESEQPLLELQKVKRGSIGQFFAKALIVAGVTLTSFWLAVAYLNSVIDQRMEYIDNRIQAIGSTVQAIGTTKIGGRAFWLKVEDELEKRASDKDDLIPEKKRKILAEIRSISDRWRPFIFDILSTVKGEPVDPAKQ